MKRLWIIFLLCLVIGFTLIKAYETSTIYKIEIEQLHEKNELLELENKRLDQKLVTLENQKTIVLEQRKQQDTIIGRLKQQRHEKANPILNYNHDELYWFFSNIATDSTANR